jgi:membrane-bound lytic murein transglycosylase A
VTILRNNWGLFFILSVVSGLLHCARSPLKDPEQALRPTSIQWDWQDDLQRVHLHDAIVDQIRQHQKLTAPLRFGSRFVDRATYIDALQKLDAALGKSPEEFRRVLNERFIVYEPYGDKKYGDVFITSYFEPIIKAAKRPTANLSQPLYSLPRDLVTIDLKSFEQKGFALQSSVPPAQRVDSLRGRLVTNANGAKVITPYFDRHEIDDVGSLKNQNLEIAYVDPIDAFTLQIQGSGVLKFSDGRQIKVGYVGQNGFRYVPIGKFLTDKIPIETMTLQKLETAVRAMSTADRQALFDQNPSYVFFAPLPTRGLTTFGTPVIDGRTIATDGHLFPKGTLALLEFEAPVFRSASDESPSSFQRVHRLVFDQDTGGAIRGPGRVDLFWGAGDLAKKSAGTMRSHGRLFYFVPR